MKHPKTSVRILKYKGEAIPFKPNDIIFKEGDSGVYMFVIRSGTVQLMVEGEVVNTLQSGDFMGEMALLDNELRSATAVAVTDCELVPVDKKSFEFMVQQTPYFALDVMQIMADRLRHMNHIMAVSRQSARSSSPS